MLSRRHRGPSPSRRRRRSRSPRRPECVGSFVNAWKSGCLPQPRFFHVVPPSSERTMPPLGGRQADAELTGLADDVGVVGVGLDDVAVEALLGAVVGDRVEVALGAVGAGWHQRPAGAPVGRLEHT